MLKHMFESSIMAQEIIFNVFPTAILDLFREVLMGVFLWSPQFTQIQKYICISSVVLAPRNFLPTQYFNTKNTHTNNIDILLVSSH